MTYKEGLKDGLPIGLGYFSVSFSFGIMAVSNGLSWWQAVLISITNLTSAGQVAGVGIMGALGGCLEMAITTFIINLRYALMSISLSQKCDKSMNTFYRILCAFFITDEIFGVSSGKDRPINKTYMFGLATLPFWGWTLGTLLGAVCGNILPSIVTDSLAIGIYGMFVAIVLPVAKKSKQIAIVSIISVLLSVICFYVPFLRKHISSGFAIIICSVVAALIGAFALPYEEKKEVIDG